MENQIKIGDVVQLKSGGPKMVVDNVRDDLGTLTAWCSWFSADKKEESRFPVTSLKRLEWQAIWLPFYSGQAWRGIRTGPLPPAPQAKEGASVQDKCFLFNWLRPQRPPLIAVNQKVAQGDVKQAPEPWRPPRTRANSS